ncbi:MAG: chromosome segregation protein SMC, partial [Nitrospirota bacterium]|nr:chromosome segregation protein SMC [Nitrospirota bacterium]
RLKDIRGFLWNARAGTRGQSVIEQGNIEQLLSASPQERREFIEGTAGIIRYKKQKAEALRKLQSTENNLLRVRDILGEVHQQLRVLTRQAKQAEEYQGLLQEARDLEVRLLTGDFRRLFADHCEVEKALQDSENRETACVADEVRLVTEQQQAQLELGAINESLQQAQDEFREIERRMSQALTEIQIERNRIEQYEQQHEQVMEERTRLQETGQEVVVMLEALQARMVQARVEIDALAASLAEGEESMAVVAARRREIQEKVNLGREAILAVAVEKTNMENRLRSLAEGQSATGRRMERLAAELTQSQFVQTTLQSEQQSLQTQRSALEQELEGLRTHQEQLEVSLQSHRETREELDGKILELQTQTAGTESELKALQGIFREELGYGHDGDGADASIREQCSSIQAALAERLQVPEEVELAIESALGGHLQAWILNSPQEAQEAIDQFQRHQLGKGRFIPVQIPRRGLAAIPDWWTTLEHDPAVKGLARKFVDAPTELRPVIDGLLQDTVVVETLADAMALMHKHDWFQGEGPCLVTKNGEIVTSLGVVSGGESREAGGLLRRRREILILEENLQALQEEFKTVQATRKVLCQEIEEISAQFEAAISAIREKELQVFSVKKEEASKGQALPDVIRRLDLLQQDRDMEESEFKRMQAEEVDVRHQLESLERRRIEENGMLAQSQDSLQELEQEHDDLAIRLNDIKMNHHTLYAQLTHEQSNQERLEGEEENRKVRVQDIDQQLEQLFLQSRTSQEKRLKNEEAVEGLGAKKESKGEQLRDIQNRHADFLEEVKRLDALIGKAREALSQIFKSRVPIEGRLAEVRTKLQAVEETLTQTYEISTDDLKLSQGQEVAEIHELDVSEEEVEKPEEWREHLQRIRKKLERIGPINLAAIDEHVQLEERYQFLLAQEEDLAGSIQSLQEIIERLNQTTNKLFIETFKELQVKFNEVFSALFAGGRAELVLVDESENVSGELEPAETSGDSHDEKASKKFKQEPGVEIVAQPPGKRLKNLTMLSGGEKTMTVMALLFASFLIRPSPFCVLDEVDAPLDETNVVRFGQFLKQMAGHSQFIVITHNKRTMEVASSLFGVTMEEPGVSKLISVRLHDLQEVG